MGFKEDVEYLLREEGQTRGTTLQTDREFIKKYYGKEGLERVKLLLKDAGSPIEYEKINALEWHPIGLRFISLLAIKEAFNLDEQGIRKIGSEAPKTSFIAKLLMKTFFSIRKSFENAPIYWRKHWTRGELILKECDEEKRRIIIALKDFNIHPVYCKFGEGYYETISSYVVDNPLCREISCSFRGGETHNYEIIW